MTEGSFVFLLSVFGYMFIGFCCLESNLFPCFRGGLLACTKIMLLVQLISLTRGSLLKKACFRMQLFILSTFLVKCFLVLSNDPFFSHYCTVWRLLAMFQWSLLLCQRNSWTHPPRGKKSFHTLWHHWYYFWIFCCVDYLLWRDHFIALGRTS